MSRKVAMASATVLRIESKGKRYTEPFLPAQSIRFFVANPNVVSAIQRL